MPHLIVDVLANQVHAPRGPRDGVRVLAEPEGGNHRRQVSSSPKGDRGRRIIPCNKRFDRLQGISGTHLSRKAWAMRRKRSVAWAAPSFPYTPSSPENDGISSLSGDIMLNITRKNEQICGYTKEKRGESPTLILGPWY